ncbi:phasin family protein [Temperatibacter marinus]|uniref:Phasin family protein n=1 Tax=Temperatibacter marinus TaxID=1456591 RepID=A0AA52H9T7_9PROT|nr:phasin family protein [Temperatibacter marinus]WND02030.1 phasin family protein [Temperatibacter marinus]
MPATKKKETKAKAKPAQESVFGFDAFTKMFETAPQFDVQSALDFQKKNLEAMVEANRVMFDCAKEVATKQADFAKIVAADLNDKAVKGFQNEAPEFNVNKQIAELQANVKTLGENVREVADMTTEAGQKAFTVLQERYTASVEEVQTAVK